MLSASAEPPAGALAFLAAPGRGHTSPSTRSLSSAQRGVYSGTPIVVALVRLAATSPERPGEVHQTDDERAQHAADGQAATRR